MTPRHKTLLAVLSGLLYLASFPPSPLGFLSPVALALLLPLMSAKTKKEAFLYPFLAGIIFNTGLLYWIPRLMQQGLYVVLAIGLVLLIAYLSLWVGLSGLLVRAAFLRSRILGLVAFPVAWTAQEKLRELGDISFPWVMAGYTLGDYTRIIQALSLFGVYFYTFLVAGSAVLLFLAVERRHEPRRMAPPIATLAALFLSLFVFGSARLAKDPPAAPSARISLLQANVDPNVKWSQGYADSTYLLHCRMTLAEAPRKPDLMVWSESALPSYFLKKWVYRTGVSALMDTLGFPVMLGGLDYEFRRPDPKRPDYFNSVFYYAPGTGRYRKYDKIMLLPFAERLPFEGLFPIISRVDLGEADFTPGDSVSLFDLAGRTRFFTPICYEVVYPWFIRGAVNRGGELMVQVTNDGWFGRSAMPFQHANIARYRAVECGIPVARCANTGVSCFIDANGRFLAETEIFTTLTLTRDLPLVSFKTPYRHLGDVTGWSCLILAFGFILFSAIRGVTAKRVSNSVSETGENK